MRLRQIVIASKYIKKAENLYLDKLKLNHKYKDPEIKIFGLQNIVSPVGNDFLEIISPIKKDTSVERFINKFGDMHGYMIILQVNNALIYRNKLKDMGLRKIWEYNNSDYISTHYHPKDFNNVLLSIDSTPGNDYKNKRCSWPPAGKDWLEKSSDSIYKGYKSISLAVQDPEESASYWCSVLGIPKNKDDICTILLQNASIKFKKSTNYQFGLISATISLNKLNKDITVFSAKNKTSLKVNVE